MRYGSVCSGIEAATVAWHPLGWEPVWFSEIERFPCQVLAHHYPEIPNLGDMRKLNEKKIFLQESIDLLVGGTPCQSFSVAGLGGGLADPRGDLALEFCRLLASKRPKWFVWENVPGVLSNRRGADLGSIFKGFQNSGYSFAWRVLDAQYFGVPQRRNRIFVVGYLGNDWRPSAAVLFEPYGLRRHIKKGRKAREEIAGNLDACPAGSSRPGYKGEMTGVIARPLNYNNQRNDGIIENFVTHTLTGNGHDASEDGTGRGIPIITHPLGRQHSVTEDGRGRGIPLVTGTIDANYGRLQGCSGQDVGNGCPTLVGAFMAGQGDKAGSIGYSEEISPTLRSSASGTNMAPSVMYTLHGNDGTKSTATETETCMALKSSAPGGIENSTTSIVQNNSTVRRLTPLECERLQGFPDGYTAITGAKDSPRYSAIGNSMEVHVMRWLGRRIDLVDQQLKGISR